MIGVYKKEIHNSLDKMKVVFILAFVIFAFSSFEDGKLNQGEVYGTRRSVIFDHPAYRVFRFPYGIDFHQLAVSSDFSESFAALITHTECPGGNTCKYDTKNSHFVEIEKGSFRILRKYTYPIGTYYEALDQKDYISNRGSSNMIMLSAQRGGSLNAKLTNLRSVDGYPLNSYNGALKYVKFGETSGNNTFVFSENTIKVFSNFDLTLSRTLDFTSELDFLTSLTVLDNFLYISGRKGDTWSILKYNLQSWSLVRNTVLAFNQTSHVLSKLFIHAPSRSLFATFENSTYNREDFEVKENMFLYRYTLDVTQLNEVKIKGKQYSGHFWNGNDLYLVSNSDLIKIQDVTDLFSYEGNMRIRMSPPLSQSRSNNLYIDSAILINKNRALIGSEWWGLLVDVDLNSFIRMEDEVAFVNGILGLILGLVFGLPWVLICCCLACISTCICIGLCCGIRRNRGQKVYISV